MFSVPKLDKEVPVIEACAEFVDGVATRDVHLSEVVWVRIFLPQSTPEDQKPKPVVLYAHGGAYCFGQPNWPPFHIFCAFMSKLSNSIWVSVSYRLAPAHRLPAAYDDASFALRWIVSQAHQQALHSSDPWLTQELADFSNFFFAGESAGASIMLKVAMDVPPVEMMPIRSKGLILVHPGFHSEEKRGSMVDKELDNLQVEALYDMAVPIGETLNYPLINPIHEAAPPLTPLSVYPHILICVAEKDNRYDMTLRFYRLVQDICPHVVLIDTPGKGHVFHLFDPFSPEASDLRVQIWGFMQSCTAT